MKRVLEYLNLKRQPIFEVKDVITLMEDPFKKTFFKSFSVNVGILGPNGCENYYFLCV